MSITTSQSNLVVSKLTKIYSGGFWPFRKSKPFTAVNGISFELHDREILGLLGPNGAGKTTTIQMLLGLLDPSAGDIIYFGQPFAQNRASILKKVAYASGYDKFPCRLSIWDNLDIYGRLYGVEPIKREKRIAELLTFFNMWNMRYKQAGELSAGQMTRIALCKAFISQPSIVLLDEPTASLDPDVALDVRTFIKQQREQYGTSILFTSHNMTEVTELCDRVLMLKDGSIIADDTPLALARSVSRAHVHLVITQGAQQLRAYCQQHALSCKEENDVFSIDCDEHAVGPFLVAIARQGVEYSHVSIDKPTLEDYFLSTIKKQQA